MQFQGLATVSCSLGISPLILTLERLKSFGVLFIVFLFAVSGGFSQDVTTLPTSQLQATTRDLISDGEFVKAQPYLVELERRLIELPPIQQGEALESVYLFLTVANLQSYAVTEDESWLEDAIEAADKYIAAYPRGDKLGVVLVNKADAFRAQGKFAEAAPVLIEALRPPAVDGLRSSTQLDITEKIVQAFYVTENWTAGIPWFQRLMEYRDFPEKVSLAATALVEAYIATDRLTEMMQFLPVLVGNSSARYNIRLNVKLIEAADRLIEQSEFAQASFLFNLVLSKNELIEYHQGVLERNQARIDFIEENELSREGLSKLRIDAENAKNQVEALKEVDDYSAELEWRKAQTYQKTGRDYEAFWAFYRLLNDFPDREDQLEDFHYAAFVQANQIEFSDMVIELGEAYILNGKYQNYLKEVTFLLADVYKTEGPFERFRNLATRFVIEFPNDEFAGAMIYLLAEAYTSIGDYEALANDFGDMIATMSSGSVMDGLYYWRGMAGIFLEDYDLSRQSFTQLFDQYRQSAYLEDAEFRMGVVQFASGDLGQATRTFNDFLRNYPESVLRGEAHVYLGDLYAADAEVDQAIRNYMRVSEYTDEQDFIDHAYFQASRLCEENEFYGRMATILAEYLDKFPESPTLSKAIFELGRAYDLQGEPVKGLLSYRDAIEAYGDMQMSFGVDEIIEIYPEKYQSNYLRLKSTLEFIERLMSEEAFREEIVGDRRKLFEFLSQNVDIDRDVHRMIMRDKEFRESLTLEEGKAHEVVASFKQELTDFPSEKPEESFEEFLIAAKAGEKHTFRLRMLMALQQTNGVMPDLESFTRDDLKVASPTVMVWMARLIRESKDLSLEPFAREALELVIADYRQDEAAHFEALVEYGLLEKSILNFDAAQSYFLEARERYPFDDGATDATVLLADAYRAAGKHEEAIENYNLVLRDKSQYGKAVRAEVQYKIGLSYFERGEFQESHAYFERVFLAFSGFREWAAKAYLKDAQSLISLGAREDAARTLREAIKVANIRETEAFGEIEMLYQTLVLN